MKKVKATEQKKNLEYVFQVVHPKQCASGSNLCAVFFLVAFFFYYAIDNAREYAIKAYLHTYVVEGKMAFTKEDAATLH